MTKEELRMVYDTIGTEGADVAHVQDLMNLLYDECFKACETILEK